MAARQPPQPCCGGVRDVDLTQGDLSELVQLEGRKVGRYVLSTSYSNLAYCLTRFTASCGDDIVTVWIVPLTTPVPSSLPQRIEMANFTDWDSQGLSLVSTGEVYAAGVVFPIVCATVTGLRFYVRSIQKFQAGIDDWLVLFALVRIRATC